ncbi:GNAT family N-acetyltransferase, partial [Pantoea endophytica]
MNIRSAVEKDAPVITDIYNDAVLNSTAIWNDKTV